MNEKEKLTGVFCVIGRPNAGKSTLTNALCGAKVAIVSDKPQTTRTRITGVRNQGDSQMIFIDTPGLHRPKNRLGEAMVRHIYETVEGVDAAVLVVEPVARVGVPEELLLKKAKETGLPLVLVINKIDQVKKEGLLAVIAAYQPYGPFHAVVPVSAKTEEGLGELADELRKLCFLSPQLFPDGMRTDQPEQALIAELIREKLLRALSEEVPHGIAVVVEKLEEREKIIDISAVIVCERSSHKGIIIGRQGAMLKKTGGEARADIEALLQKKVFLELWVKVKEDWRNRPEQVRSLGFDE